MNYLAHLLLADPTPAARIGSLLPDLVRGPLPAGLDPGVARAVSQHRAVDRVTDTHPATLRAVGSLRERHGRFAGVLADVFFDHFLASDWSGYCHEVFPAFVSGVYDDLIDHPELTPPEMWRVSRRMARQDWLGCYATLDGIELTLRRMSRYIRSRVGQDVRLDAAVDDLARLDGSLRSEFRLLWSDLVLHAAAAAPAISPDPVVKGNA